MPNESDKPRTRKPHLRKPDATDGAAIWELVKSCKPLDENSMYCNLVQTDHFRETCVVAELDGDIVGWISGYMIPDRDELFVWQVAVSPQARGLGLGREMLRSLTQRSACADATHMKTTITKSNEASWALFKAFSRSIGSKLLDEPHFERDTHFEGQHATEHMVTIALSEQETLARAA